MNNSKEDGHKCSIINCLCKMGICKNKELNKKENLEKELIEGNVIPVVLIEDNLFDKLIVDELDRLNPSKCPAHSYLIDGVYKTKDENAKCIGCKIGIETMK